MARNSESRDPSIVESDAATKIQKFYQRFRRRRNHADCILAVELEWLRTYANYAEQRDRVVSVPVEVERLVGSLMHWVSESKGPAVSNSEEAKKKLVLKHFCEAVNPLNRSSKHNAPFFQKIYGLERDRTLPFQFQWWTQEFINFDDLKELSKSFFDKTMLRFYEQATAAQVQVMTAQKAWKLALQYLLEAIDPRRRCGVNLIFYFSIWSVTKTDQPFFYWLDVGDRIKLNHLASARRDLQQKCNTSTLAHGNTECTVKSFRVLLTADRSCSVEANAQSSRPDGSNQMPTSRSEDGHSKSEHTVDIACQVDSDPDDDEHDVAENRADDSETSQKTALSVEGIFLVILLILEVASAISDQLSSSDNPIYACLSLIFSCIALLVTLFHHGYQATQESVIWRWKGWAPWFYYPPPSNKCFGTLIDLIGLLFTVAQFAGAIIAYRCYSRHQNNPIQFSAYTCIFSVCVLCSKF